MDTTAKTSSPKSSGETLRLICAVAACVLVQLCAGILYLWSVLNASVQAHYSWDKSSANLVSSFMLFGFVLGNLIGGIVRDKTNPKLTALIGSGIFSLGITLTSFLTKDTIGLIYLTYSAMAGIGCGFIYGSILGCLLKLFPNRRGFASGLSVAAFAASTVIFAPLITLMLDKLSVPEVFRYLGIAFLVITIPCCLLIRLPRQTEIKSAAASGLTVLQAIKLPAFWCIFLFSFFINATWNVVLPIIKPLGEERSLSATAAGVVIMLTGIANATGRFSAASASDKLSRGGIMLVMSAINVLCAIALVFARQYFYLVVIVAAAFCYGGPAAVMPAMTVDLAGARYSGTNYGIILLSLGLSSVAFTAISNALYEATNSYTASFIVAAAMGALSALTMLLYMYLTKRSKRKPSDEQETNIIKE